MSAYRKWLIEQMESMYQKYWVETQRLTETEAEVMRRTIMELRTTDEVPIRL